MEDPSLPSIDAHESHHAVATTRDVPCVTPTERGAQELQRGVEPPLPRDTAARYRRLDVERHLRVRIQRASHRGKDRERTSPLVGKQGARPDCHRPLAGSSASSELALASFSRATTMSWRAFICLYPYRNTDCGTCSSSVVVVDVCVGWCVQIGYSYRS